MATFTPAGLSNRAAIGPTCTAAETVYSILEIRREIFRQLSRGSLARFMRVEKACTKDVIGQLYRAVKSEVAVRFMCQDDLYAKDANRHQLYLSAITEIDAHEMTITRELRRIPGWEWFKKKHKIDDYCPREFNFVVPLMRFTFPSLRKIHFGETPYKDPIRSYEYQTWTVCFDPSIHIEFPPKSVPIFDHDGYTGELGGTIHLTAMRCLNLLSDMVYRPIHEIAAPPSPKGSYSLSYRFNLQLSHHGASIEPEICRAWCHALKHMPGFENIYTHLYVRSLPITFDEISALYQRQVSAGHTQLLQRIRLDHLPWEMGSYASFASVASSSLTSLQIIGVHPSPQPTMTIDKLPEFMDIVMTDLPSLTRLAFGLKEPADLEAICKDLLSSDSLREGGSIKDLRVELWNPDAAEEEDRGEGNREKVMETHSFNIIRALSPFCTATAEIAVDGPGDFCGTKDQTAYLSYLRRQPPHCQRHLATIDFPSLGLTKLRHVHKLNYHDDGQPFLVRASQPWTREKDNTAKWSRDLKSFLRLFKVISGSINIEEGTAASERTAGKLDEISASAPTWEKLALAEDLLRVMAPLKEEVDRLSQSLDVDAVRAYVESLRTEMEQGPKGDSL